jgi:hypothetical protein
LGRDTFDLDEGLAWVGDVLMEVSAASGSVGFALASRYVADRAASADGQEGKGLGLTTLVTTSPVADDAAGSRPAIGSWLLGSNGALVIDAPSASTWWIDDLAATTRVQDRARTGLSLAKLTEALVVDADPRSAVASRRSLQEWDALLAAVCVGVADASLSAAEGYAQQRFQFGAALSTFTALRALMADMAVRVDGARVLVERALAPEASDNAAAVALATAARAAVDVGLDAIQVHGGYGYTDEYPVADRLRDAVSLRARGGGRRLALATVAQSRLHGGTS